VRKGSLLVVYHEISSILVLCYEIHLITRIRIEIWFYLYSGMFNDLYRYFLSASGIGYSYFVYVCIV
jgi:hypothetical protein